MNLWTIFRYCIFIVLVLLMDSLLYIKIPVVAVIVSADMAVQCSIWFPTNTVVVLGLHIQIHARAVLGCTDHPE